MKFLTLLLAFGFLTAPLRASDSIYELPLKTIVGKAATLKPGKVLLIVISRDGKSLARFEPGAKPDSAPVIGAIEAALAP